MSKSQPYEKSIRPDRVKKVRIEKLNGFSLGETVEVYVQRSIYDDVKWQKGIILKLTRTGVSVKRETSTVGRLVEYEAIRKIKGAGNEKENIQV